MAPRKRAAEEGPPRRGRPPAIFRGRAAAKRKKAAAEAAAAPAPPPPPAVVAKADEAKGIEPLSAFGKLRARLMSARRLAEFEPLRKLRRIPDFLAPAKQDGSWTHVKDVPTHEVYQWFEHELNDYLCHSFKRSRAAKLTWIGHPGDSPADIRARELMVSFDREQGIAEADFQKAMSTRRPVLRWVYHCAGIHDRAVEEEEEEPAREEGGGGAGDAEEETDSEDEGVGGGADNVEEVDEDADGADEDDVELRTRWRRCSDGVKLRLEVTADDLSKVHIWIRHSHPAATRSQSKYLQHSRHIRLMVLERLRVVGAKVSIVKKGLQSFFNAKAKGDAAATRALQDEIPDIYVPPPHRIPKGKQMSNMLKMVRQRERLDRNPLFAVHILARRDTHRIYCYTPHDLELPDALSSFMVALTDDFSMDSLILHGSERGWALDSSWRNKNENRAAVTLLIAVDEHYHAVPGAVFLSANTRADTLEKFLAETKIKLRERAAAITKGAEIEARTPEQERKLRGLAERWLKDDYEPSHFMIDKCWSELHAILRAYPQAVIRLCQFHVVQAITRLERDSGDRGSPMRLGIELKAEIIYHFRRLQRCRRMEDWPATEKTFFRNVQRAIVLQGRKTNEENQPTSAADLKRYQEQYDFIYRYFKVNWFTDDWLPTFTDIGLPEGQTRDGTWNTNNWIERSFRTFDAIFLEHRKNKRLDRLALIILHDFLPYFKNWPPEDRVIPADIRRLNDQAHNLWEHGCITKGPRDTFAVEIPGADDDSGFRVTGISLSVPTCPCEGFEQTGKMCVHLKAASLYHVNGPIEEWQEEEVKSERRRLRPSRLCKEILGLPKEKRLWSDEVLDTQLDDVYKRLQREDEAELKHAETAEWLRDLPVLQDPTVGGASPGRPSAISPLQPHRTPSRKTSSKRYHGASSPLARKPGNSRPIFSRPPGPPKATRLSRNSLLAGTQAVRTALRQAAEYAKIPEMDFEADVPANTAAPPPMALDGPLRAEEFEMQDFDFTRWIPATYMWRLDEAFEFREILNNSEVARSRRMLFWLAPDPELASAMQTLSCPSSNLIPALRGAGQSRLAELIASRADSKVDRMVFAHCDGIHWTLHDHDLLNEPLSVRTWNSLPTDTHVDLADQLAITACLRRIMHTPPVSETSPGDATTIDPRLLPVGHMVLSTPTGLQVDSFSCGFWATFFAWATLLDFNPHQAESVDLCVPDLKGIYAVIWIAYRTGAGGVPTALIKDIFAPLGARVDWNTLGATFSQPPATDTGSTTSQISPPVPALVSGPPYTIQPQSVLEDPCLHEKLRKYRSMPSDTIWRAANDTFHHVQLLDLLEPKMVVNEILDAALALVVQDLRNGIWDRAFGDGPEAACPDLSKVVVNTWSDVFYIRKASPLDLPGGLVPPKKSASFWYPEVNIFEQDQIIIPYYWKEKQHFMCAIIDCREERISVYDSLHDKRRAAAMHKRLVQMVEFEYRARMGANFQETRWVQRRVDNESAPQQKDTYNCAAYTLKFALESLCGRKPERPGWTFNGDDARQLRKAMALRLLKELPVPNDVSTNDGALSASNEYPTGREIAAAAISQRSSSVRADAHGACEPSASASTLQATALECDDVDAEWWSGEGDVNIMASPFSPRKMGPSRMTPSAGGLPGEFDHHHVGEETPAGASEPPPSIAQSHPRDLQTPEGGSVGRHQTRNPGGKGCLLPTGAASQNGATLLDTSSGGARGLGSPSPNPSTSDMEQGSNPIPSTAEVKAPTVGPAQRDPGPDVHTTEVAEEGTQLPSPMDGEADIRAERTSVHLVSAPELARHDSLVAAESGAEVGDAQLPVLPSEVASSLIQDVDTTIGKESVSATRRRSQVTVQPSTRTLRSSISRGRESSGGGVEDSTSAIAEDAQQAEGGSIPAVGEWHLLVYEEEIAPGCAYRAVPGLVTSVKASRQSVWIVFQPDADLLWLQGENITDTATAQARELLKKSATMKWETYMQHVEGLCEDEIAPMVWPADLEYHVSYRQYVAGWLPRRRALGEHLEALLPVMSNVIAGQAHADVLFSGLIRDGMRAHGYDEDGERIPGASQNAMTCQEWFDSRTAHGAADHPRTKRKLLDAGDEALVAFLANKLGDLQPIGGPFDRLYVKTATAGRVYLAFAALEWYTGISRTEMAQAIEDGCVGRPESRWEQAWEAYARLGNLSLEWSHRVLTPRLEVPVPINRAMK